MEIGDPFEAKPSLDNLQYKYHRSFHVLPFQLLQKTSFLSLVKTELLKMNK